MKIILLSLLIISLAHLGTQAQDVNTSTEKRINLLTRVMATELGLNELEYIKLKTLNRERIVKADEIAEFYGSDQELHTKKLLELETNFDKKLRAMLTPSQLAAYAAYKHSPDKELALSGKK